MPTKNKKVKNASPMEFDGIEFRSRTEVFVYRTLKELGLNPEYEKVKITLLKGFRPHKAWFHNGKQTQTKERDTTYTPDFSFSYKNRRVYLEVKGFPNDVFPLKRKMFLDYIEKNEPDAIYIQLEKPEQLIESLKKIDNL